MRAIMVTGYGSPDVLELREVPTPVPTAREVLIRIRATTVTTGDWRARSLSMPRGFGALGRLVFGLRRPRQPILGTELAGVVDAVGAEVTRFSVGDPVFAFGGAGMGCHAEYRTITEEGAIAPKPAALTFEEAAAISFGGTTALAFLRRGKIARGESILINGASGCVGTAAVQLARHFGAEVTGVCSGANAELVRSLGAHRVIDYTETNFSDEARKYDIIMDTVGSVSIARGMDSLAEGGRLLLVASGLAELLRAPWVGLTSSKRVLAGPVSGNAEDLRFLAGLVEADEFRPVIDRCYPFEEMADAHRHVDGGHKRGSVVVSIA